MTSTRKLVFETDPCSRCGGDGTYPSLVDNGRCFGCAGTGRKLTRRGKAAKHIFDTTLAQMDTPIEDVQIGARVLMNISLTWDQVRMAWCTVTESHADPLNAGMWTVVAHHASLGAATTATTGASRLGVTMEKAVEPTTVRVWDSEVYDAACVLAVSRVGCRWSDADPEAPVEPAQRPAAARTAGVRTSHADCTHPATPRDRAACRKQRANG